MEGRGGEKVGGRNGWGRDGRIGGGPDGEWETKRDGQRREGSIITCILHSVPLHTVQAAIQ